MVLGILNLQSILDLTTALELRSTRRKLLTFVKNREVELNLLKWSAQPVYRGCSLAQVGSCSGIVLDGKGTAFWCGPVVHQHKYITYRDISGSGNLL